MKKQTQLLFIIFILSIFCTSLNVEALSFKKKRKSKKPDTPLMLKDFSHSVELQTSNDESFYELTLPVEAYQHVIHKNLSDLRIFNKAGQIVPHVIQEFGRQVEKNEQWVDLKVFPITKEHEIKKNLNGNEQGLSLSVKRDVNGTIINIDSVEQENKDNIEVGLPKTTITSYLIDVSQIKEPINNLQINWKQEGGSFVKKIWLEESSDLQNWTTLVQQYTLAEFEHLGHKVLKNKFNFRNQKTNYLRLRWSSADKPWEIVSIKTRHVDTVIYGKELIWSEVTALKEDKHYLFNLGGYYPVKWIKMGLPEKNTLVNGTLYHCNEPCKKWHYWHSGQLYRLFQKGLEFETPQIAHYGVASKNWKLEISAKEGLSIGAGMPIIKFGWQPQRLIFLAQGEGPYRLAVGNKRAAYPYFNVKGLLSKLDLPDNKLPQAQIGTFTSLKIEGDVTQDPIVKKAISTPTKKIILWVVMLIGVGFLIFMAIKLMKQLNEKNKD
ncbi:hypothetical protein BVY03_03115 [bacterium K02(2017)]|nr:hypothetical protein BVY03_03115 [bacterium K02(2017)]